MDLAASRQVFADIYKVFVEQSYEGETTLAAACRYALEGGGKHTRPLLAMLACQACQEPPERAMLPALALEMIHTYSLVHDDLPCMDDDDLRRGRPTVHCKFNEATAVLVGDALLSDAWAVLCGSWRGAWFRPLFELGPAQTLAMVPVLSQAIGSQGMVLGQALDLHWTGRTGCRLDDLKLVHQKKTGALIGAACTLGGIAGNARLPTLHKLQVFGECLGQAFQIIDDLLDESEGTGKSRGKDKDQGKLTYLSTMPRSEAQRLAEEYTERAVGQVRDLGEAAAPLEALASQLLARKS